MPISTERSTCASRAEGSHPPAVAEWGNSSRRWRTPLILAGTLLGVVGLGVVSANAGTEPRLAENVGCQIVTIAAGDNVWSVGDANHVTLDQIARWNPQISNLALVYPGDEIALNCGNPQPVVLAPAVVVSNEVQRVSKAEPWVGMAPWPGFNQWLPGDGKDGVASQAAVLRALHAAGARGNQLIGLAAITEGESNRRLDAVGDTTIQDGTWGPAVSPFQIRTLKKETGTGSLRDIREASSLDGGARAAVAIYNAALGRGQDPLSPWTCHKLGNDRSFVEPYRALATAMGLLS